MINTLDVKTQWDQIESCNRFGNKWNLNTMMKYKLNHVMKLISNCKFELGVIKLSVCFTWVVVMRIENKHSSVEIDSKLDYLNLGTQIKIELLWFNQSCVQSYNVLTANWSVPATNWSIPATNWSIPATNWDVLTANWGVLTANWDVLTANWDVQQNMLLLTATNNWSYCITHHESLDLSLTRKA